MYTVKKLSQEESQLRTELINLTQENDQLEIEHLLSDQELCSNEAFQECIELLAQIQKLKLEECDADEAVNQRYIIDDNVDLNTSFI